ncbi:MAG TPA: zinc ribbon domain-containing protein [Vicinamibacterales bacterium]
MPLFEYKCAACGHLFEHLTRAGVSPACPKCSSDQLEKQLSVFAVAGTGSSSTPRMPAEGACANCPSAGGCGMMGSH